MVNQMVLVGRIVDDPVVKETSKGKVANITLAVQRSYKNKEGIYETDFVDCTLWNGVAQSTSDYCKKGDIVGIKGSLHTSVSNNGIKSYDVSVEKLSFLSTMRKTDDTELEKDINI